MRRLDRLPASVHMMASTPSRALTRGTWIRRLSKGVQRGHTRRMPVQSCWSDALDRGRPRRRRNELPARPAQRGARAPRGARRRRRPGDPHDAGRPAGLLVGQTAGMTREGDPDVLARLAAVLETPDPAPRSSRPDGRPRPNAAWPAGAWNGEPRATNLRCGQASPEHSSSSSTALSVARCWAVARCRARGLSRLRSQRGKDPGALVPRVREPRAVAEAPWREGVTTGPSVRGGSRRRQCHFLPPPPPLAVTVMMRVTVVSV